MSRIGDFLRQRMGRPRKQSKGAGMPAVRYATSPLLASRTPTWRVKFMIGAIGLGYAVLIGRATWIQNIHNDYFYDKEQRRELDLVQKLNAIRSQNLQKDPQLEARIKSFETAFGSYSG
jgi:cell division protein FtsI (penicillin-binding protein 3)